MHPDLGNLLLELKDLGLVARTDFEELLTNLSRMEVLMYNCTGLPTLHTLLQVECKSSLGFLSLSHSYCDATRALITSFLEVLHIF